jgi:hypothetical protein
MSDRISGSTRATCASPRTTSSSAAAKPACSRSSAADGKIVWQAGPDFSASKELRAIRQIIGQHHAHLIPKGLPGAGNLLVFDNGGSSGYGFANPIAPDGVGAFARATSRVLEINPVTLELVWSYTNPRFFSTNISSAQRLLNGNTLITAGAGGRLFEVTKEGTIVWEYMFPMFAGAGPNPSNAVYRAYRIPYGWIPQLTKPTEQRLTPPALGEFRVSASGARSQSLAAADCTAERLGTSVAPSAIGETGAKRDVVCALLGRSREWRAGALSRERIDGVDRHGRAPPGRSTSASCCRRRGHATPRSLAAAA